MLAPQDQWCHQIVVTSACWPKPSCSNCTRLLGHEATRYHMSPEQFEACVKVAAPFITESRPDIGVKVNRKDPSLHSRKKVLGIFGGEPLMHPQFPDLVDIMCQYVPLPHRGLWTSFDWVNGSSKRWGSYKDQVVRLLGARPTGDSCGLGQGYLNWNMHEEEQRCEHSPVLAASQDLIPDEKKRWETIENCWVQIEWSAAYALDANNEPKFYFCEIASAFDRVFNLGTGLPVEDYVWAHELWFEADEGGVLRPQGPYAHQILSTCGRCGAALKLPGRRDRECTDDVSPSNFVPLSALKSPMLRKGQVNPVTADYYKRVEGDTSRETPWEYQKDSRAKQIENFTKALGHADWLKDFKRSSEKGGDSNGGDGNE